MRTHIIKRLRRPAETTLHDPVPGGYGNRGLCAAIRTDQEVCGVRVDRHDAIEKPGHWCQPSGGLMSRPEQIERMRAYLEQRGEGERLDGFVVDDEDRQPCLYCGVPLVRLGDGDDGHGDWHYAEGEVTAAGKQLGLLDESVIPSSSTPKPKRETSVAGPTSPPFPHADDGGSKTQEQTEISW